MSLAACGGCQDSSGPGGGKPGELQVAWRNPLGSAASGYNAWLEGVPAVANGQVFVEDVNQVVALDAASGNVQWSTKVKDYPNPASPNLVVRAGLVIIGDRDVQALDVATGALRWQFRRIRYRKHSRPLMRTLITRVSDPFPSFMLWD